MTGHGVVGSIGTVKIDADVWMENRGAGNLSVTTELLLAPQFSAKLNMKEDLAIKNALFQYLLSSEKII